MTILEQDFYFIVLQMLFIFKMHKAKIKYNSDPGRIMRTKTFPSARNQNV